MTITKLNKDKHYDVLKLFGKEVDNYYFIISDLINSDYVNNTNVFGEYEDNELKSILINNNNNLTYYSNTIRSVEVYKKIINNLTFKKITGPNKLIKQFIPFISAKRDTVSYLGYINELNSKKNILI